MRQLKKKGEHNWMPPKHAELLQQLRRKLPPTHTAGPAETLLGAHNAWVMSRAKLQLAGALGENGQRCKCWKPVLRATQVLWWSVVSQGSAIWDGPCSVTGWMHFPASFLQNISSAQRKKWDQPNSLNEREHDTCTKRDRQTSRATSRECGRISGGRVWKTETWLQREESECELDRERWRQGSCLEERARGEKGGGKVRGTQWVQNNLHSPQRFLFKKIKKEWWRRGESQTSLMMCVQSSDWKNDREKQPVSALINCSLL